MILVTGATGFVGRHLCAVLAKHGEKVRLAVRAPLAATDALGSLGDIRVTGELGADTDWRDALQGVDAVVHLASRVHVMHEQGLSAEALYRQTNVLGTRRLAEAARAAGVNRFILISSVKAVGERGFFDAASVPAPLDAYGRSKSAAEQSLYDVAVGSGMAVIVIRPPLVYGPGVGANFLRLLRLVDRRIPLPLAGIRNRRSLVYVGNLVSAIQRALEAEIPTSGTYFVDDGEPVSTPALIRLIAASMQKTPNLWSCPFSLLNLVATAMDKRAELARLTDNLVVDGQSFCQAFGWTPPYALQDGVYETVQWYRLQKAAKGRSTVG